MGCNIDQIASCVGKDTRIGPKFLKASLGFGGSCFEKDILALIYLARSLHLPEVADYWYGVLRINQFQKDRFSKEVISTLHNNLEFKKICIFGAGFKQGTSDARCSATLDITKSMIENGAKVNIYDPMVKKEGFLREMGFSFPEFSFDSEKDIEFFDSALEACSGSQVIVIATEWEEFKEIDYAQCYEKMLKPSYLFDGRVIMDVEKLNKIGFETYSIGRGGSKAK